MPLPHSHFEGEEGLRKNVAWLEAHRRSVGPDFPLMVDCYMSLTVNYAIRLAHACEHLNIHWWEEVLSPDDTEGYREIKRACPFVKWTTGEHEYTRYGFRHLIEERTLDHASSDVRRRDTVDVCGRCKRLVSLVSVTAALRDRGTRENP